MESLSFPRELRIIEDLAVEVKLSPEFRHFIIRAAIEAPSGDNMQPWLFRWTPDESLEVFIDTERTTSTMEKTGLAPLLSIGAVLENIRIAAADQGIRAACTLFPSRRAGSPAALVNFDRSQTENTPGLVDAIFQRRTNRGVYDLRALPLEMLAALAATAEPDEPEVRVALISDECVRNNILETFAEIDAVRFGNKTLHEELFQKLCFGSDAADTPEGLSEQSLAISRSEARSYATLKSWTVMRVAKQAGIHRFMAKKSKCINATAPILGAIIMKNSESRTCVRAGQLMQRLWLQATTFQLGLQPVSVLPYLAPLCTANLDVFDSEEKRILLAAHADLRAQLGLSNGETFAFFFRLGFPVKPGPKSKRRPLHEFMKSGPSASTDAGYDYDAAVSRHAGLISEEEQRTLRSSCVAIAGLGGVGGSHLITLARLGIGKFHLAEMDRFECANINRQHGAMSSTLGRAKLDVMADLARDVNPQLCLRLFEEGLTEENLDEFLNGADLVIDGLDFFEIEMRRTLFREARRRGLWVITAGPHGASAGWIVFSPHGMDFDTYFDLRDGMTDRERTAAFAVGLVPQALHLKYVDLKKYFSVTNRSGGSLGLACNLASGIAAAQAMKILLGRGGVKAAPWYGQFDAYRGISVQRWLHWGNRNFLQRLKRRWLLGKMNTVLTEESDAPADWPGKSAAPVLAKVRELSVLDERKALLAVVGDWAVIFAALWIGTRGGFNPLFYLPLGLVIASRQHALGILMHDAAHFRLLNSRKWNDRLSDWLLAFPMLVSTKKYRAHHLAHHRHLNSEKDPDWARKNQRPDWKFPMSKAKLLGVILRDMFGRGFIDALGPMFGIGKTRAGGHKVPSEDHSMEVAPRLGYYGAIGAALALTGTALPVLLLWFVPMFTLLPGLLRIRSLARHFGLAATGELNQSRNYICPAWERFIFCPHYVGYHLDHHLFPSVPFYNLPELHRFLAEISEYRRAAHENTSLFFGEHSVVADLTAVAAEPPGPRGLPWFGSLFSFGRDPLKFHERLLEKFGAAPLIAFRLFRRRIFVLNSPELVEEVFIKNQQLFSKDGVIIKMLRRIAGENLFTREGEDHVRSRRACQPAYTKAQLRTYAGYVNTAVRTMTESWTAQETIDARAFSGCIALRVITRSLFSITAEEELEEINEAVTTINLAIIRMHSPSARFWGKIQRGRARKLERSIALLDAKVSELLALHDSELSAREDIVSVLKRSGELSTEQIRAEVFTMFVVGQESVATALTWSMFLIAQHLEIQEKIRLEAQSVAPGRELVYDDLDSLSYTKAVLQESVRIFPPVWIFTRRLVEDFRLGGYLLPKNSMVVASQFMFQRNSRYFPEPLRFKPERWLEPGAERRARLTFFPFGIGRRVCIGKTFAEMEATLAISSICRNFSLELISSREPDCYGAITLQPKDPILLRATRRCQA